MQARVLVCAMGFFAAGWAEEPAFFPAATDEEVLESAVADQRAPHWLALRWRLQGAEAGVRPARLYQRLEWKNHTGQEVYLLAEKDPGEARWADFAAFYLKWQDPSKPLQLVAGDLRPGFGQGLIFGRTGGGYGIPWPLLRRDSEALGHRSSAENQSLRGLALRYQGKRFSGVLLGGRARRDARLDEEGRATSLPDDGMHVSASEEEGRKQLQIWTAGFRLRFQTRCWQAGLTLLEARFDRPVDLRRPEKTPWAFHGPGQGLWGADARVALAGAQSAAEIGRDRQGHWGFLSALQVKLGRARARALLRSYAPGFHSLYGGALSAADQQNEQGVLLLLKGRWRRYRWQAFADQFRPVQPTYSNPLPNASEVWGLSAARRLGRRGELQLLYQDRTRPYWQGDASRCERSQRGRVQLSYGPTRKSRIRLRLEGRRQRGRGDRTERGGMVSLQGQGQWHASRYVVHLTRFLTPSYSTRIYEFEYDLPGAVSIRPLYGNGWRFYLLAGGKWRGLSGTGRYRFQRGDRSRHYWGFQVDIEIGGRR